jgi:hypothetical protein
MTCDIDEQRFWLSGWLKFYFSDVTLSKSKSHKVDDPLHIHVRKVKINFNIFIDVGVIVIDE